MSAVVEKALDLWGMGDADWRLVAARENHVYKVVSPSRGAFALRLHRPDFRSDAELWSELEWMGAIAEGGLNVPAPVPATDEACLQKIDGLQVDVLTWLNGAPLGATGRPLNVPNRLETFRKIGSEMARLHEISDAWAPPEGFQRWSWDRAGLLGDDPLWGRFWENPTLSDADRALFTNVRSASARRLGALEGTLDFGLIHADLVRENLMIDGDEIHLIDFDDAGFGFRLFDMATFLLKNGDEPDYPDLKKAFIDGYKAKRAIDADALDLFLLLRALTYVGWIVERMNEDGAELRNARFINTARRLARQELVA
ncbi:MAG: phosphotransferase [Pseudomonadota bacterium]